MTNLINELVCIYNFVRNFPARVSYLSCLQAAFVYLQEKQQILIKNVKTTNESTKQKQCQENVCHDCGPS